MVQSETDKIFARREGTVGRITLRRPKALNALTISMIRAMAQSLDGSAACWNGVTGEVRFVNKLFDLAA
jgi:enoyl-CoA hydratase/carnithine racemase